MKDGELVHEGLAREVLEETGLKVESFGRLVCTVQLHVPQEDLMAIVHILQVVKWSGPLQPQDPDKLILEAAFFPCGMPLPGSRPRQRGRCGNPW